ncbi:MAG TPA: hypothetical protein VF282_10070, partial [Bacillota bacterium]
SERRILQFLRAGRLRLQGNNRVLTCSFCGDILESGQICPRCAQRLRRQAAASAGTLGSSSQGTDHQGPRVYTADRRDGRRGG